MNMAIVAAFALLAAPAIASVPRANSAPVFYWAPAAQSASVALVRTAFWKPKGTLTVRKPRKRRPTSRAERDRVVQRCRGRGRARTCRAWYPYYRKWAGPRYYADNGERVRNAGPVRERRAQPRPYGNDGCRNCSTAPRG